MSKSISINVERLGFDQWFREKLPEAGPELAPARVVAVHKERFTLNDGEMDVTAELVGKLAFGAGSPTDFPTVGDWVVAGFHDQRTFAIIHGILPRKSLLKRKTPGKNIDFQLIAANVDVAFIVQSLDANFNLRRLERYLVMVNEARIKPVVLLSKCDLSSADDIVRCREEIRNAMPHLQIHPFSNTDETGLEAVVGMLRPRYTYCLVGSSGVGKTTLLNHLVGAVRFKTKAIRTKDGKGRHATTHRQLILLESGAMVVDTPGMRELGNFAISQGLEDTFTEIFELSQGCRFSDCQHINERGCAVLAAMVSGQLSEKRYANYIKLNKESKFNEMSYHEKRRKDKQFGKMVRSVMKQKKNRR